MSVLAQSLSSSSYLAWLNHVAGCGMNFFDDPSTHSAYFCTRSSSQSKECPCKARRIAWIAAGLATLRGYAS